MTLNSKKDIKIMIDKTYEKTNADSTFKQVTKQITNEYNKKLQKQT